MVMQFTYNKFMPRDPNNSSLPCIILKGIKEELCLQLKRFSKVYSS